MSSESKTTLTHRELPPVPTRLQALRLVFSPDRRAVGRVYPLDGDTYTFGREVDGSGMLNDLRLSRAHARVVLRGSSYALEDLQSSNGTFLDGVRVTERVTLKPGQVLSIGNSLLVVDEELAQDELPADPGADETLAPEAKGDSFAAIQLRRAIATVAPTLGTVLLLGESGTGKEVAASAIHRLSKRTGPFIPVNCAAIPGELAEAELFGARKGAFTGATHDREGYFVKSAGGTLFLDEIGDLGAPLQAKLLRVLEDQRVQAVGGGAPRPVDLRVVAATKIDLMASGFREDLLARLGDWVFKLPPLSQRRADVLPLFKHFVAMDGGDPERGMTAEFAEALLLHDWSLNIRELKKMVTRLLTLGAGVGEWDLPLLPERLQAPIRVRRSSEQRVPTKAQLEAALAAVQGNVSKVADQFGCDRRTIYRWLQRMEIDPAGFRKT